MKEPEQEIIDDYPDIYYDYDYEAEIKKPESKKTKRKTSKPKKKNVSGCPPGYIENEFGKCLHPEIQKINKSAKELEIQAKKLADAWEEAVNLSTGRIPFEGKKTRLNIIGRLFDENIEDLKNIKRNLFW